MNGIQVVQGDLVHRASAAPNSSKKIAVIAYRYKDESYMMSVLFTVLYGLAFIVVVALICVSVKLLVNRLN